MSALMDNRRLSSRDKFTCYGCNKRQPGCHDSCEEYKRQKQINDDRKAVERRKREEENAPTEYSIKRNFAAARKKIRER